MNIGRTKTSAFLLNFHHFLEQCSSIHSISPSQTLQDSIKAAVESKSYKKLPGLFPSLQEACHNPNLFLFLSTFPLNLRTQVVDEILQSLIFVRPRSKSQFVHGSLLFYTLQSPSPFPLSLPVLQRILHSGCVPSPQTHFLLSSAWLKQRSQAKSVANILMDMQSIGYKPDSNICNYLISSLCSIGELAEAFQVLKGMGGAGCVPDLESYGTLIRAATAVRRTDKAVELLKEMVVKVKLMPRQRTIINVVAALRANREVRRAVEIIELLERDSHDVGFESYELLVEGCLECREYILAGKVIMAMTDRGFIPYIKVRQKVVEGLYGIGELELASAVRRRFVELGS
ncbi:pentatricopeptide repeat-containing protein [Cucumis melo var. makuwa]|uniref:Pentatricopeptide repeat-containing protein At1g06270 n=2 Tax=Cucumis melo TaxID=3656 RepID=A0A1S3C1B6_CUCME|nr:pentatricopeptide repeat-containing protein At1g06270 [Cucumis melo]XP_008455565.2 pentatricopeptide repeat-containing protein At1g06270 [Cucumis melo]KAA0063642.1 pentatricopeptide repeat-containing protein [Cucumis melo var. makuwa]TYK18384.1 pentatricopeptide repeat-containing protein [Cucumis melo var. makuwa]